MKVVIIAALANNNVIGFDGKIPWYSQEDLKFFKEQTSGHAVIMGRKTFESLDKQLGNRINIIISKKLKEVKDGYLFHSLTESLEFCKSKKFLKVFIIGGGKIYEEAIRFADELIISKFNINVNGDTFFPAIDEDIWIEKNKIDFNGFSVYNYLRKI